MKGFKIIHNLNYKNDSSFNRVIKFGNVTFLESFNGKFELDKAFYENDNFIIIHDGITLNKNELFKNYQCDNMASLLWKLFNLRGGILYLNYEVLSPGLS
jgi:hypothetical protein